MWVWLPILLKALLAIISLMDTRAKRNESLTKKEVDGIDKVIFHSLRLRERAVKMGCQPGGKEE